MLSKRFAVNCTKNERTKDMFPLSARNINLRNPERFEVTRARTNRLFRSSIPTMQRQLNDF